MYEEKINAFLSEIKTINWFERCGVPNEKYHMVFSLYDANDGIWGMRYHDVWEQNIVPLEDNATDEIGDDAIDDAFETISEALGDDIWKKFGDYVERCHLGNELAVADERFDAVMRDIAWACIEYLTDKPGFFTMLMEIYKEGHFPCSWDGEYPAGRAVVL